MLQFKRIFYMLMTFLLISPVYAGVSLGEVSERALMPAEFLVKLAYMACLVIGIGLILASGIQYNQHRNNPLQVRLSQPIYLLIFGLILILIPIVAQLSKAARF